MRSLGIFACILASVGAQQTCGDLVDAFNGDAACCGEADSKPLKSFGRCMPFQKSDGGPIMNFGCDDTELKNDDDQLMTCAEIEATIDNADCSGCACDRDVASWRVEVDADRSSDAGSTGGTNFELICNGVSVYTFEEGSDETKGQYGYKGYNVALSNIQAGDDCKAILKNPNGGWTKPVLLGYDGNANGRVNDGPDTHMFFVGENRHDKIAVAHAVSFTLGDPSSEVASNCDQCTASWQVASGTYCCDTYIDANPGWTCDDIATNFDDVRCGGCACSSRRQLTANHQLPTSARDM